MTSLLTRYLQHRVLAGYLFVARTVFNADLLFVWDVNVECPGHFLELFKPIEGVAFISNSSRVALDPSAKAIFPNTANRFETTMAQNGISKKGGHWSKSELHIYREFLPTDEITTVVNDYIVQHVITNSSAMHLRQTDMYLHLNVRQRASYESYYKFVNTRPDDEKIFLMADNPTGQKKIIDKYGDRILVYSVIEDVRNVTITPSTILGNPKNLNLVVDSPTNTLPLGYRFTSLKHTLYDILISANAKVFKGSPYSSLSDAVNIFRKVIAENKK